PSQNRILDYGRKVNPAQPSRATHQKKFPMVNSKTMLSSPTCLLSGMPHSNRNGPMGENQRKPKPTEVRRLPSTPRKRSPSEPRSAMHGSTGPGSEPPSPVESVRWSTGHHLSSVLYELPASKKITP